MALLASRAGRSFTTVESCQQKNEIKLPRADFHSSSITLRGFQKVSLRRRRTRWMTQRLHPQVAYNSCPLGTVWPRHNICPSIILITEMENNYFYRMFQGL
jgi:hypothetical protein